MKFELSKETAVEKTYLLAGRTLSPGGVTKFWYGTTVASTASAFLLTPEFFIGSVIFGGMGAIATWFTARTTKECLDKVTGESKPIFKRKNRKDIAKDGTRELLNQRYVRHQNGYWQNHQPFEASHESKLIAFRDNGKLQFEEILTELPHTTWEHAFNQLTKEDQIILDGDPRPGFDWKERKKELGMLPTDVYYLSES